MSFCFARLARTAALLTLFGVASFTVCAQDYSYFTERRVNSNEYVYSSDYQLTDGGVVRDYTGQALEFGLAGEREWAFNNGQGGYFFQNEYSDVYAKADLATGQLKARSSISSGYSAGGVLPAFGYRNHNASASAAIGDTIRFGDGSGLPYLWASGDQFTFNLAVVGNIALPENHATPLSGGTYAIVTLSVARVGAFALGKTINEMWETVDWDNDADLEHLMELGDTLAAMNIAEKQWLVGDSLLSSGSYAYFAGLGPDSLVQLNDSGAAQLQYSFHADGDFEFYLSLETVASIDYSYEGRTSSVDFSHTLTTSFIAPEHAVVTSASGLLPGTVPAVPEPEGIVLALAGIAVAGVVARRRHA